MVPPPPDLQPVIASYAEFVARHGAEAEMDLRGTFVVFKLFLACVISCLLVALYLILGFIDIFTSCWVQI